LSIVRRTWNEVEKINRKDAKKKRKKCLVFFVFFAVSFRAGLSLRRRAQQPVTRHCEPPQALLQ
jgi:hypothetical protein